MGLNIAVLGATGAVGRQMVKVLEEYDIPINNLRLFASAKSAGQAVRYKDTDVTVEQIGEDAFRGADFVLGAVQAPLSAVYAPKAVAAGAVYIDNSSHFRHDPDVPLVVPEVNGADAFTHKGILSVPNCSTVITLVAVGGLAKLSPIRSMVASTYQAVSGAGQGGLEELDQQMKALYEGKPLQQKTFPAQIALNVIPCIGGYDEKGYTSEEMKLQNEGRKILHQPDLAVTCTCVRVPVMRSHSISVTLRTDRRISVEEAKEAIAAFPGAALMPAGSDRDWPTPLDSSDQDLVYVGRIREDLTCENGLSLWCCGDQLRKGAASNAVQILKLLLER